MYGLKANFCGLLIAALLLGLCSGSHAQSRLGGVQESDPCFRDKQCAGLYERARALSDKQQYSAALSVYQSAYQRVPTPWLLVNIGRMQQFLGNPTEAIRNYDLFLNLPGTDRYPEFVRSARSFREQATNDLSQSRQLPTPTDGSHQAQASAQDKPLTQSPTAQSPMASPAAVPPVRMEGPPAPALLAVPAAGTIAGSTTSTSVLAPAEVAMKVGHTAAVNPTPPIDSAVKSQATVGRAATQKQESARPVYKKWWFWTVVGVVVAAGVTGGVVGALANRSVGMEQTDPMNMNPMQRTLPMPWFHPFGQ